LQDHTQTVHVLRDVQLMTCLQDRAKKHASKLHFRWDWEQNFEANFLIFPTYYTAERFWSILSGLPADNTNPDVPLECSNH